MMALPEHETRSDHWCWCAPHYEPVTTDGGETVYVVVHNDAAGLALELHPKEYLYTEKHEWDLPRC